MTEVQALLRDIEVAASKVLVFKDQCVSLVSSIVGTGCSDDHYLNEVLILLSNVQSRSYFGTTWMNVDYLSDINALKEKWDSLSGVITAAFVPSENDELVLRTLLASILEEYGPLKLHESRVFNEEMMSNLKNVQTLSSETSCTVKIREVKDDYLSYKQDRKSKLGHGTFGQVYQGTLRGMKVAVKFVTVEDDDGKHEELCSQVRNEATILQLHSFPGVIRLFGVDNEAMPTLMVMELAVCSLYDALHEKKHKTDFTEERKLTILLSLCGTFSFLHSIKVIHRDIKSQNVLIMPDGNVKVTDFGLAKSAVTERTLGVDMKGTLSYLAPELLLSESLYKYTEATDMYAFGILMNEVMTGQKPYKKPEMLPVEMHASVGNVRPDLYKGAANAIVPLIEESWDLIPSKRPSFFTLCWKLRWSFDNSPEFSEDGSPVVFVKYVFTASSLLSGYYTGDMVGNMRHGRGVLLCDGTMFVGNWHHNELHGWGKLSANFLYEGNFVNSRMEGSGKATYDDGEVYEGEYRNNKREGHGVMKYADGDVYDGEWKDNKPEGHGVMTYADCSMYDGEKPEGHGVVQFADGSVYAGEWKSGLFEGHGVFKRANGNVYDGEWKSGLLEGHGVMKYADGSMYDGEWKSEKPEGHGVVQFADGSVYDGEWKSGLFEGHGVFKRANGNVYDGEWKSGLLEGHGVMKYADGSVYDGEWKDEKREGHGVIKCADGSVYDGEWKSEKPEGHGVAKYADGEEYDGEWKSGLFEGHGVMKYADGDVYDGEWKNNKRDGHGVMKYADGSVYDGEWKDEKREGHGVWKVADGSVYDGEWKKEVFYGQGRLTLANGDVHEGIWISNVLVDSGSVEGLVHVGICDRCGVFPIIGPRYHGVDTEFDLCLQCYENQKDSLEMAVIKITFDAVNQKLIQVKVTEDGSSDVKDWP